METKPYLAMLLILCLLPMNAAVREYQILWKPDSISRHLEEPINVELNDGLIFLFHEDQHQPNCMYWTYSVKVYAECNTESPEARYLYCAKANRVIDQFAVNVHSVMVPQSGPSFRPNKPVYFL
ncbi:hypothetical protein Ciccas_012687, partial [Cichlidogyrus casuarinus]